MKSFFPMERGEAATLVFLIAFVAFAFIPAWRTIELGGMAVFGWLIATLMLVSPALALFTFWRLGSGGTSSNAVSGDRARGDGSRSAGNGIGDGEAG